MPPWDGQSVNTPSSYYYVLELDNPNDDQVGEAIIYIGIDR